MKMELIQRITVECNDKYIIILTKDSFLNAFYDKNFPSNITIRIDFAKSRQLLFYSIRYKYYFLEIK